jgi:hypothetical protein
MAVSLTLCVAAQVPAAGAAEGTCANRALLPLGAPDCRAWELVTPNYSEGQPVQGLTGELALAPEGTRMIATSAGVFAGSEDGDLNFSSRLEGTAYELSRTATGWQPIALGPPESRYVDDGMFDASADLESTLWGLGTLTQPEGVSDLYVEHPQGTFTEIGPPTPIPALANAGSYTYLGASADLSHVFFSTAPGYHWSFDSTVGGAGTLYEYVGTGNTAPSLVGVSGGAGSTELVSQCGTLLGSGASGSVYNAVSASGARVFFTAIGKDDHECGGHQPPVDELLAREEGPSPGETRTVAISEPTLTHCSPSPSQPCADAHFEGASHDGSKVFFTSDQKLLPEAAEGTSNLYEYDFDAAAGENLVLASAGGSAAEVQGVARISEDGSHVYFVAKGVLRAAANSAGAVPAVGEDNLYVYERDAQFPAGRTSFVATLSPADEADWAGADDRPVLASENGRYLVFTSQADLLDEGTAPGVTQVYQYDATTGTIVRASVGGLENDLPFDGATLATEQADAFDSPTNAVGMSAPEDGAVFFSTPNALVPRAEVAPRRHCGPDHAGRGQLSRRLGCAPARLRSFRRRRLLHDRRPAELAGHQHSGGCLRRTCGRRLPGARDPASLRGDRCVPSAPESPAAAALGTRLRQADWPCRAREAHERRKGRTDEAHQAQHAREPGCRTGVVRDLELRHAGAELRRHARVAGRRPSLQPHHELRPHHDGGGRPRAPGRGGEGRGARPPHGRGGGCAHCTHMPAVPAADRLGR